MERPYKVALKNVTKIKRWMDYSESKEIDEGAPGSM